MLPKLSYHTKKYAFLGERRQITFPDGTSLSESLAEPKDMRPRGYWPVLPDLRNR